MPDFYSKSFQLIPTFQGIEINMHNWFTLQMYNLLILGVFSLGFDQITYVVKSLAYGNPFCIPDQSYIFDKKPFQMIAFSIPFWFYFVCVCLFVFVLLCLIQCNSFFSFRIFCKFNAIQRRCCHYILSTYFI